MIETEYHNDGRITPRTVLDAIVNLKQLVFEVTDACNLCCRYCAYGDLYSGYDKREDRYLSAEKGRALIDYLDRIWCKNVFEADYPTTYISFYGGEPLMNMAFVKSIVEYVEGKRIHRDIHFSMTSNALLLHLHIDYLVQHNFNLLISLDGDKEGNGYRVTKGGTNSFDRVVENIKAVKMRYPEYFQSHVNFNTVLHNRNSVESVTHYFQREFGKTPTISELNTSNIREDKQQEFYRLFQNKQDSFEAVEKEIRQQAFFLDDPKNRELLLFLHQYSGNVFKNYSDLLLNPDAHHFCPTGTCYPFGKKMFLTVNGKILQCEKISQNHSLGSVDDDNRVQLDFQAIADTFNAYLSKMQRQCSACFRKRSCSQCLYYINEIEEKTPHCQGYMSQSSFDEYCGRCLNHLFSNPELYHRLLFDVMVD